MYDKNKAKDWSKRNVSAFEGLLNVNQFLPVTGDIQSGIMAAQDVKQGNYGSAALNSLGLLPFIPALGGITAWHGSPHVFRKSDITPSEYGVLGPGVYLAERLSTADRYGKNSYKYDIPDDLNLFDVYKAKSDDYKNLYKQNNVEFNPAVENYLKLGAPTNAFQAAQKDLGDFSKYGYEGIKGYSEFGGNEYAIFNPKKLKY